MARSDTVPPVKHTARGGWHLYVECAVCTARDTFDGFVASQALDAARTAGWSVDGDAVHTAAHERIDLCPSHR